MARMRDAHTGIDIPAYVRYHSHGQQKAAPHTRRQVRSSDTHTQKSRV